MDALGDVMTCLSTVAIILNVILLPLIAFKSGRDIGSYKVLLFLYSLVAIVHTTSTLLLVPVFEPSDKGWLFYATVERVSRKVGSFCFSVFSACYIKLLLILTYSFVYRYFVMCAPHLLIWYHRPKRILVLVLIYSGILGCCAGPVISYMSLNPEIAASYAKNQTNGVNIDLEHVAYIGAPMFRDGHLITETAYILSVYTTAILSSTAVCLFCIVKIIQAFWSTTSVATESANFQKLQRRLFILLILQTMVPFIFTFIPALLSYFLAYMGTRATFISQISSASMPMAQLIDPVLIFSFIGEYRKGVVNGFRRIVLRHNVVATIPVTEVTSSKTSGNVTALM